MANTPLLGLSQVGLSLGIGLLVGLGVTIACELMARHAGFLVKPRLDRWNRRPIPVLGGLAIVIGTVASLPFTSLSLPSRFTPFLLLTLVMAGVGLIDDLRSLRPQVKLVIQIFLAALLIELGQLLPLGPSPLISIMLTLFWVVGVTNAFNLLDNMDGLAAGMAIIASSFRLGFFLLDGDVEGAALMAGFSGATLGFLVRNFPPAKIFMGDTGSLFIGFFLSGVCLMGESSYSRGMAAVLAFPVLLVLIPIFDTTFVTLTRFLAGRQISRGGRDHTSHRLVALGISERRALGFLFSISILSGLGAIVSYRYGFTYSVVLLALLVLALVLLGVYLSRIHVVDDEQSTGANWAIVGLLADFRYKRQVAAVTVDLVLIITAYYSSYLLRFESEFDTYAGTVVETIGPVIALQVACLALSGNYRGLWRYTSVSELLILFRGTTLAVGVTVLYFVFTTASFGLSRTIFVLDWILLLLLLSSSRVSFRLLSEMLRPKRIESRRVLIYGAGDGGELTLRELRRNAELRRDALGFLDDDRSKIGTRIHGIPVYAGLDEAEDVFSKLDIGEVIVSSESISPDRLKRLEEMCACHRVRVVRATMHIG